MKNQKEETQGQHHEYGMEDGLLDGKALAKNLREKETEGPQNQQKGKVDVKPGKMQGSGNPCE